MPTPDDRYQELICLRCDGTGKAVGIGGGVTRCPCCGGSGVEYVEREPVCEEVAHADA